MSHATSRGLGKRAIAGFQITVDHSLVNGDWDQFVASAPGGSHLQTSTWAQVKSRSGWRPFRVLVTEGEDLVGGCQMLLRRLKPIGDVGYVARGPLAAYGRPDALTAIVEAVLVVARAQRLLIAKLQPAEHCSLTVTDRLRAEGWHESDMTVSPSATIRVNSAKTDDELLAAMSSGMRRDVRIGIRGGLRVRVRNEDGIDAFAEQVAATGGRQGFTPYPGEYYAAVLDAFQGRAALLLVEHEGRPIAGSLLVGFGDTVTCKMAAWSGLEAKLCPSAFVHWEGLRWARDHGYRSYDFDGMSRQVAESLQGGTAGSPSGVDAFKLRFGGTPVLLPQTYDRNFHLVGAIGQRLAPHVMRHKAIAQSLIGRRA